ncbi:unnamed protein product [Clonostachys rosea]|uniref:Uncharacterized protein n=1 Tax=Bionectria ochroleuca TaxID=29856 RepID=A0ABY6UNL9_BIOOC|nr:unnamed protein product [Clonostachys rosea]
MENYAEDAYLNHEYANALLQAAADGDIRTLGPLISTCPPEVLHDELVVKMLERIPGQSSKELTLQLGKIIAQRVGRVRDFDVSVFTYSNLRDAMGIAIEKDETLFVDYLLRLSGPLDGQMPSYDRFRDKHVGPRSAIMMRVLVQHGLDINQRENGHTPLHHAFASPYAGDGMVQLIKCLASNMHDINQRDEHGYTPLHAWLQVTQEERWREREEVVLDITTHLLDNQASLTAREQETGDTPLHVAVQSGPTSLVELLLSRGADPNARNRSGETPLHDA